MKKPEYQGWKNYETWNVALWIKNDQTFYLIAKQSNNYQHFVKEVAHVATTTPEGTRWNDSALDIAALDKMIGDL